MTPHTRRQYLKQAITAAGLSQTTSPLSLFDFGWSAIERWQQSFDTAVNQEAYGLVRTQDGQFVVASYAGGARTMDPSAVWLVKFQASGESRGNDVSRPSRTSERHVRPRSLKPEMAHYLSAVVGIWSSSRHPEVNPNGSKGGTRGSKRSDRCMGHSKSLALLKADALLLRHSSLKDQNPEGLW